MGAAISLARRTDPKLSLSKTCHGDLKHVYINNKFTEREIKKTSTSRLSPARFVVITEKPCCEGKMYSCRDFLHGVGCLVSIKGIRSAFCPIENL